MKNWYKNMTKGQKIFVYFVSAALVMVFGIGLLPLAILIYLELGQSQEMENELALDATENPKNETSLSLAASLSFISYLVAFCTMFYEDYGMVFSTALFDHPAAFSEFLAKAFGGSILFPIVHVGVASCFKTKRNPSSRRNIFIGWAIAIIIIQLLTVI